VLGEVRPRRLHPYAVSACSERQHHVCAAATDSLPDDSADESDPADNVDDADTENATTSTAESVATPPLQTLLIAVKTACFNRVTVWLWCRAGILASVAVAQTLSHPWTVVARCAARPFAWCCVCMAKCTSSGQ